jgi:RNA ligase (TIGR02306 family)
MLNKNKERELAYVVIIDAVTSIPGYDRVELAHVGGWTVVVGKGEFHAGDPAIYFEIDSKLPEVEPFTNMEFLAKKGYKVKTQKMCKSISQGLLISAESFGWTIEEDEITEGLK